MKKAGKYLAPNQKGNGTGILLIIIAVLVLLIAAILLGKQYFPITPDNPKDTTGATETTAAQATEETEPKRNWQAGFVATLDLTAEYYGPDGAVLGTFVRGAEVEYEITAEGKTELLVDSELRAEKMKENFRERPETIYRGVNALLAGNVNYLFD